MQFQHNEDHPLNKWAKEQGGNGPPKTMMTPKELATYWAMAPHTLANWRHQGIGPHFKKVGARVLYAVSDVINYENHHNPADK